jgi:hypothetical protein
MDAVSSSERSVNFYWITAVTGSLHGKQKILIYIVHKNIYYINNAFPVQENI